MKPLESMKTTRSFWGQRFGGLFDHIGLRAIGKVTDRIFHPRGAVGWFFGFAAATVLSSSHAADWPQFRGLATDGVSTEALPGKLDARNLLWTASLPGRGLSSPIILGERVFVTCSSGPKQDRLHVICFNAR